MEEKEELWWDKEEKERRRRRRRRRRWGRRRRGSVEKRQLRKIHDKSSMKLKTSAQQRKPLKIEGQRPYTRDERQTIANIKLLVKG